MIRHPTVRSGPGIISGPVQRIADGDAFTVRRQRMRICSIGVPEMATSADKRAREAMAGLVTGRCVSCTIVRNALRQPAISTKCQD